MKIVTSILGVAREGRETGASVVDAEFVRHALALGHAVHVLVPQGRDACVSGLTGVHLLDGGEWIDGICGRLRRLVCVWRQLLTVYRAEPDAVFRVNSFFSSLLEVAPLLLLARGRLRLFVQFHHKDDNRWRNVFASLVIKKAQVIICPSNAARDEIVGLLGQRRSGLYCVHHGVGERFFIPHFPARDDAGSPLRLLFVGHLELRKNPAFLVGLAQALHGVIPFVLTIVGSGPEAARLGEMCEGQPWSSAVVLAGEVTDAEKMCLYTQSDVFVFPSRQEGFGLVLCEAMAAGVPVLAFDTSAMPEIVKPGTGFLVPVDDAGAMVSLLQLLATDRKLLQTMREQTVAHARNHFAWQAKVKEVFKHLESAFEA